MNIKEKYLEIFKNIALEISKLSTCAYTKVGAIIVKNDRILAEGYNGTPSNFIQCNETDALINGKITSDELKKKYGDKMIDFVIDKIQKLREENLYTVRIAETNAPYMVSKLINPIHNIYEVHAEINAITQCSKNGININGASIITTHLPCFDCAKAIVSTGIKEVYYINEYKDKKANDTTLTFFKLNNISVYRI